MTANSAAECMAQVQEAARAIRVLLDELPQAASATVVAEDAYRRAYTRSLIKNKSERSDIAKALADMDTEVERLGAEQAKAQEKRVKEALHSWRSILSALQTVATGYREEARFARVGPGGY